MCHALIHASWLFLLIAASPLAAAEQVSPYDAVWAQEMRQARQARKGPAVFWLDGSRSPILTCSKGYATLLRQAGAADTPTVSNVRFTSSFFGSVRASLPVKGPAGDYVVTGLTCDKTHYTGTVAKFTVKPGEVVNLGRIVFAVKGVFETTLEKQLEPMFDQARTIAQQRSPVLMSMMVDRPMTLLGPASQPVKRN